MSTAVASYTDSQSLFREESKATFGTGVLDYILLTQHLVDTLPVTDLLVRSPSDLPLDMGVKFDHNILTLKADLRFCERKPVPLLCRHWHKRHVAYFCSLTKDLEPPKVHCEQEFNKFIGDLLKLVHRTNFKFFGKVFYSPVPHATGSEELRWLRRLAWRGGKQFFSVCKSESLNRPHSSQLFPKDSDICNHMENNPSSCQDPLPPPLYLTSEQDIVHPTNHDTQRITQNFNKMQFDMQDLLTAIKCRKAKAGAMLPPFALAIATKYHNYLLRVLNTCIMNNHLFESIKITNLWLLFKQGDRLNPTSYRPISIPHPMYNILARMTLPKVQQQAESQLFAHQYGFRRGYSCSESVLVFRSHISRLKQSAADNEGGLRTVFVDITKAFDSVPHHQLFVTFQVQQGNPR